MKRVTSMIPVLKLVPIIHLIDLLMDTTRLPKLHGIMPFIFNIRIFLSKKIDKLHFKAKKFFFFQSPLMSVRVAGS